MKKKVIIAAALVLVGATASLLFLHHRREQQTLRVVTTLTESETLGFRGSLNAFADNNPDFTFEVHPFEPRDDAFPNDFPTADVILISQAELAQQIPHNFDLAELDDPELDLEIDFQGSYSSGLLGAFEANAAGSIQMLPIVWSPYGFFINTETFARRGIGRPSSWTAFTEAVPGISQRPSPTPIGFAGERGNIGQRLEWMLIANGPEANDQPTGAELFETWTRREFIHPGSSEMSAGDAARMLENSRLAMVFASSEFRAHLTIDGLDDVSFLPMPVYRAGAPALAARVAGMALSERGARKPVARAFAEFLASPTAQELWITSTERRFIHNTANLATRDPNSDAVTGKLLNRAVDTLFLE